MKFQAASLVELDEFQRLADAGLTAFRAAVARLGGAGERVLRTNYLCLQCGRLILGETSGAA